MNIPGATATTYTIASAQLSDNGAMFRCIVTNSFGSATSNNATLTVNGAPNTEPVVWTSLVGVSANGSTLTKTASTGWGNAGAVSTKSLQSGNGYVEATALERNTQRIFGLGNGNTDNSAQDIAFGIHLVNNGTAYAREGGVKRGPTVTYGRNDKLRVEVNAGAVRYSLNGVVFYTSLVAPTYPLLVDSALHTQGATIGSATISGTWSLTAASGR